MLAPRRWLVWVVPATVYVAWLAWVSRQWQAEPFANTGHNFGVPLAALARLLGSVLPPKTLYQSLLLLELIYLLAFAGIVIRGLRRSRAMFEEKCILGVYALLAACASGAIWVEDWSFLRVLTEFHAAGVIVLIGMRGRACGRWILTACLGLVWIALFVHRTQLSAWVLKGDIAP